MRVRLTTAGYDLDYRITLLLVRDGAALVSSLSYAYGDGLNLTAVNDNVAGANSVSLGYPPANRLGSATGPWGSASYTYDAVGNRPNHAGHAGHDHDQAGELWQHEQTHHRYDRERYSSLPKPYCGRLGHSRWLPRWLLQRNHLGTADAVSGRRPPHHRNPMTDNFLVCRFNRTSLAHQMPQAGAVHHITGIRNLG